MVDENAGEGWNRPIPLNAFDVKVDRIEVRNRWTDEPEDIEGPDLDWSLFLVPMQPDEEDGFDSLPNYVMVGHLLRVTDEALAQVRSHAYIRCFSDDESPIEEADFRRFHAPGYVESIYDSCRRSLESAAAHMDLNLDLPHISPLVEILTRGSD